MTGSAQVLAMFMLVALQLWSIREAMRDNEQWDRVEKYVDDILQIVTRPMG